LKAAIEDADFVILSVWFSTIQDLLKNTQTNFKVRLPLIHQTQSFLTEMADISDIPYLDSEKQLQPGAFVSKLVNHRHERRLRRWTRQCGSTVIDERRPVVMAQ
jgi:hypothetical protein